MLNLGHNTTTFNADSMIQVARAVGLKVTSASYVILEGIWFCFVLVEVVRLTCAVFQEDKLSERDGHDYWRECRVTVTVFFPCCEWFDSWVWQCDRCQLWANSRHWAKIFPIGWYLWCDWLWVSPVRCFGSAGAIEEGEKEKEGHWSM